MNRPIGLGLLCTVLVGFALQAYSQSSAVELKRLGDFYQLYLVRDDRRPSEDDVQVKKNRDGTYTAEMSYWRSLSSRDPGEEICQAYHWLLFGRGVYGKGSREAFEKYPQLFEISLRLYDIEFGTRVGKKRAEILPTQKMIPYLKLTVSRNAFLRKKFNTNAVKKSLEKGKCAQIGRELFDNVWIDEGYIKQAK